MSGKGSLLTLIAFGSSSKVGSGWVPRSPRLRASGYFSTPLAVLSAVMRALRSPARSTAGAAA